MFKVYTTFQFIKSLTCLISLNSIVCVVQIVTEFIVVWKLLKHAVLMIIYYLQRHYKLKNFNQI